MAKTYIKRTKNLPKKQSTEEDTSNLPYDIILNILSRLPVKSLFRFKSVSKPWKSMISGTEFAKIHLHQSKNSDSSTLCILSPFITSSNVGLMKFSNRSSQLEALLEFPLKKYRQADVLCSCNGLILLKNTRRADKMYVLWNPSSRTYKKFSCPYANIFVIAHGICYDPSNDDYKVILITPYSYAVFSYKNNLWLIKQLTMRMIPVPGFFTLFTNGFLHFVGTEICEPNNIHAKEDLRLELLSKRKVCRACSGFHYVNCPIYKSCYDLTHEIYYFDPTTNEFKKFPKPDCLEAHSYFELAALGGNLCLYRNTYDKTMVEIWMMKTYGDSMSWIKFMTIENVPISLHLCSQVKPLCLTDNGDVLLDITYSHIVVYNPKEVKFEDNWLSYVVDVPNRRMHRVGPPVICLDTLSLPTRVS